MSEVFSVVKLATCLASVILASAIYSRDPGLRINRLMALVPGLIGFWSLGEFVSNLHSDPIVADRIVRATSGAWMMLGPACLHIYAELAVARRSSAIRLAKVSYAMSGLLFLIHCATGLGMVGIVQVPWGYQAQFGASFAILYANFVAPAVYVFVRWGTILSAAVDGRERRVWSSLIRSVFAALGIATLTDVMLPVLGVPFPPLGSTAFIVVSYGVLFQFKRYGYSLTAPSAFAEEILEALGGGVVLLRANGEVRIANAAFAQWVGGTPDAVRNVAFSQFAPSLEVDPAGLSDPIECDLASPDGALVPVLISPTRLFNPFGNLSGVALVIRDLREVSALRFSLLASDRLATVGGLATSIASEIREPIHEMRSHLEAMQMQLDLLADAVLGCEPSEKLTELVDDREELIVECLEGVDRIQAIVRDVRGISSGTSGPVETVDLNDLIEEALRTALARARPAIAVEKDFDRLSPVQCMPGEIVQVLVNLMVNAFHAIDDGGRVQLSSWQQDGEVWICIEDDGCGIPPDVIARIFDPFFTTKPVGRGTGLGLAISHHIIRNHGGELRVESESGRGARFTLVIPCHAGAASDSGAVSGDASG